MTARHNSLGITQAGFDEKTDTLKEVTDIMNHARFREKGKWKPFQRGLVLSTTSVIELTSFLLSNQRFNFVLPGRFLQDCLENLFSTVRSGNPKCNAFPYRYVTHHMIGMTLNSYPISYQLFVRCPMLITKKRWEFIRYIRNFFRPSNLIYQK